MSLKKINLRKSVLILMILTAAATRLINVNHLTGWANFTPVGAVALFGGSYFTDKWKAYLVPLGALFISDLMLNYLYSSRLTIDYSATFWVYLSFAIIVFIGTYIKKV